MTLYAPTPETVRVTDPSDFLKPYVPRLVVEWLRSTPDALHQELEASLVFVDISGFTALTERLAKKGKIGAELMRDTLDGVFGALLDEAYDWGAGLLKWGGDALLLLFDGPGHELRACRAAWEMQRTIDRVGRLHLSNGTLTLRMSVGIGTGAFHFFMTGSVHRELLIAGPAMTQTLQMEAIADAGEIGITPALAARLQPACVGPWKDSAILLASPPEAERRRAPDVGDVSAIDIASCIPVATRAHVLLQKSEPEHRTITAAFIDLMDTDRLLTEIGPDALAVGLDQRIRQIEEAALQFEVPFYETDVGKSSVKALLTAGAPSSTGHDEERMLRTLRRIMEQPGVVPMRIGVNTGKVFTGDFGPPYRRAYRVFGDAINTAARVMAKAEAGQILSPEIVISRSRTIFETTPIAPFAAKGKAEPVRASIVGPAIGTREATHNHVPLIGRDAELRILLDAIEETRVGNGTLVEISGETGMGKSRLLEEVIARSPDFHVLSSRCEEYEASTPYYPMRAIVRSALAVDRMTDTEEVVKRLHEVVEGADPGLVPWIPLLGILLGFDLPATPETSALDDRFLRERLAEVTFQFLARTHAGPTMLAIEDAHHMDEASRDLLTRVFEARATHPAILVLTHQLPERVLELPDEENRRALLLQLEPLSAAHMADIVDIATEDEPLHPHVVDEIARRSAGNTLFLFELLTAVRASGSVESLPDSVESLIAGEIDRLAPADRTLLRYAAVLGASFEPGLLEAAVRDDVELDPDVWLRMSALLRREQNGSVRFRNTLIRDAAYEGLPYRRRRALHERVGEAIEAAAGGSVDEEFGTLALHYYEAQRWDKAWQYCRFAGDRAMAIYANVEASRFYDMALTAGRHLRDVSRTDLAALYELMSDARYRLGEFDAADRELKAARRLVKTEPIGAAPLVAKQAMLSSRVGRYQQALIRLSRGLRLLEQLVGPSAAAARARLMVTYAGVRWEQNQRVDSIRWSRRAEQEAKKGDARDALAQAYKFLDLALKENGEIEKAIYSTEALAIFEELGDVRNQALMLNNLGVLAQERSQWDESRALYERSLALFELMGDRTTAGLAKFNIGEILSDQGHTDEAEPLLREALRVWRASGADADAADAKRELGKLLARREDFATARSLLDAAREEQLRVGKLGEVLSTDVRIAELLVMAGEADQAIAAINNAAREAATTEGGSVFRPMLERLRGWVALQTGRYDDATSTLYAALDAARERGDLYEMSLVLDALVALAQAREHATDEVIRERAELFSKLGIVKPPAFPIPALPEAGN
jgi:class 3 adenylate cyclase/tetratricopeptide (TPR) repeat protein